MSAVAILCIVCAVWWWWRRNKTHTTEPPSYPGAWPIVGHLPLFLRGATKIWDVINDLSKKINEEGGVMTVTIGTQTIYAITDPDDMYTVANTCLEKGPYYDFGRSWVGDGLVTARYPVWKVHRKLLNPAFSQTLLDTFMGVFNSQSRKLVNDLEKEAGKGLFDHWKYLRHNALESISLTSLGVDFKDSNLNDEYVHAQELIFETVTERFVKFWWHSDYTYAWSSLKKQEDACLKILHKMSNTVLQNKKSKIYGNTHTERNIPETKFKPFIDLLLELSLETGAFTDKQIREHVDTMLVAGTDTSATTLMYTMILLGSHPKVQEKLFAEIKEVLGEDGDVEKTDLSKLVYTEAVLKESMRLYPIGAIPTRHVDKDVKLRHTKFSTWQETTVPSSKEVHRQGMSTGLKNPSGKEKHLNLGHIENCTLLAGRSVILFVFAVQKHPMMWGPDADEFDPERFLEPGRLPDNPNAFAAFSIGRRNCIGKVYAMMSMKTMLAHVVRRYRITADITKMRLTFNGMLIPDSGYEISIEKRT